MQDGTTKTRKGDREIISISVPVAVYDKMQELCEHFNLNRSALIVSAIREYLNAFGLKVGEK